MRRGERVIEGWTSVRYYFDRINAEDFYKKGSTGHPKMGETSRIPYPCSCFRGCGDCGNATGKTHGVLICNQWYHDPDPRMVCVENYDATCVEGIVSFENLCRDETFRLGRTYRFRQDPVPRTGHSGTSCVNWGRKSVFGSYRRSIGTSVDFGEEDVFVFKNTRQKKSYIACGMAEWDRNRTRPENRCWKRTKGIRKNWGKHCKK